MPGMLASESKEFADAHRHRTLFAYPGDERPG